MGKVEMSENSENSTTVSEKGLCQRFYYVSFRRFGLHRFYVGKVGTGILMLLHLAVWEFGRL